jgi:cobyrinic acid a,c-diamide synthase
MRVTVPRLVVAGLSGDSGKTLVSLGIVRALADRGVKVRPFKKGPDYIDTAWLGVAARSTCRNLDTFLMKDEAMASSLATAASDADLILVEGNRGLFDGVDVEGSHSTAMLARRLAAPVVLVLDCTKMTRTAAAMVMGCRALDPEVDLAGVILNRVGCGRHETIVREAVAGIAGTPVLGAIRRIKGDDPLPGRHLGLVTAVEHPDPEESVQRAAAAVAEGVDLDRLLAVAQWSPELELMPAESAIDQVAVTIAYLEGEAFSFYYAENLERLRAAGVQLVPVDPANASELPEADGLYIGGGFPEVHAASLGSNTAFTASIRSAVDAGMPIYAECAGLMYLARELVVDGVNHQMAGVLDLVVEQKPTPQGHGYEVAVVDRDNPFFAAGTRLVGHEFHYSRLVSGADRDNSVLRVERGTGIGDNRDGISSGRVFASYLHLHAGASPGWADGFLSLAAQYAAERDGSTAACG